MKIKSWYSFSLLLLITVQSLQSKIDTQIHEAVNTIEDQIKDAVKETVRAVTKEWTFMVYIAADNDLNRFSEINLNDMAKVGSNSNLNIVAHLDKQGPNEKTKRLYIERNNIIQVNYGQPSSLQKLDSGCEMTLIDFCDWAIKNYPAKHYALVLWNHGSGISDNVGGRLVNPSELFVFNPRTNFLELDRSISFFDFVDKKEREHRGVCFSDTYNSFLTNQKLDFALRTIKQNSLNGKNIDIIGYDACLMAMTEVADLISPYADIAVFSEEVEMGAGWKYDEVLRIFNTTVPTPEQFATHIVGAFKTAYELVTQDYTFSAVSLAKFRELERILDRMSDTLLDMLKYQQNDSVTNTLRAAKSKHYCTHFSQPTYVDLDHLLTNIATTIDYAILGSYKEYLKNSLKIVISEARAALANCVLAHVEGRSLSRARGLSIYYPSHHVDSSYTITPFARKNKWIRVISATL